LKKKGAALFFIFLEVVQAVAFLRQVVWWLADWLWLVVQAASSRRTCSLPAFILLIARNHALFFFFLKKISGT
jgi:hypothetical protein